MVASGCAALIYELVWFQLLRQVIGASAISLAIVLTSFMGGMCLGSLGFPRWISSAQHPLRVYAYLEAGIGALGIALLGVLRLIGVLYVAVVGYGPVGILFRALVCLICLLPPTVLMGATLPAISRWLETTRDGTSRMGLFYAANIVGGVAGCLLAGFFLLRVYDLYVATFVAVGLNAAVAAASLRLASRASFASRASSALALPSVYAHRAIYVVIARFLQILGDHRSGIGINGITAQPHARRGPLAQQLVAPGHGPELHLGVMRIHVLEGILALVEGGHPAVLPIGS
jgi:spermidine synthase